MVCELLCLFQRILQIPTNHCVYTTAQAIQPQKKEWINAIKYVYISESTSNEQWKEKINLNQNEVKKLARLCKLIILPWAFNAHTFKVYIV